MWNCGQCASRNDWMRIRCVSCGGRAPEPPQTKRIARPHAQALADADRALEAQLSRHALTRPTVVPALPADAFLVSDLLEVPYRLYLSRVVEIGRGPENHIVLPIQQVSRHHVSIRGSESGFELADRGSMNGTLVNGVPARSHHLEENDVIRIGPVELIFVVSLVSGEGGKDPSETTHELSASSSFAGTLDHLKLPEVWQILELGQKTGRLQVVRGDRRGAIWFEGGRAIHAELGEQKGECAALALLLLDAGTFRFYPGAACEKGATITRGTTSLMLEAARISDESTEAPRAAEDVVS
jgi:pSer/pThr/pTyr-binding forkhead associated (FHA) protein